MIEYEFEDSRLYLWLFWTRGGCCSKRRSIVEAWESLGVGGDGSENRGINTSNTPLVLFLNSSFASEAEALKLESCRLAPKPQYPHLGVAFSGNSNHALTKSFLHRPSYQRRQWVLLNHQGACLCSNCMSDSELTFTNKCQYGLRRKGPRAHVVTPFHFIETSYLWWNILPA